MGSTVSTTSATNTTTNLNLCDFCSGPATFTCSQCKEAHYCSREHQASMWKDFHKIICGKPTTSFFQPDLIGAEFQLLESITFPGEQHPLVLMICTLQTKLKAEFPNDYQSKEIVMHKEFHKMLNEQSYDDRNFSLAILRASINHLFVNKMKTSGTFYELHHKRMPFFQVAEVDLKTPKARRSHKFVVQYFNHYSMGEFEGDSPTKGTFTRKKKGVFKLESIIQEWKLSEDSGPRPDRAKAYEMMTAMIRITMEFSYLQSIGGISEEEAAEGIVKAMSEIGVSGSRFKKDFP